MLFELPRDFPSLLYALKVLTEGGRTITPTTVTLELLSGGAPGTGERAHLESLAAAALFALSASPFLQGEQQGGSCPNCKALLPLAEAAFSAQVLSGTSVLRCLACGQLAARAEWGWPGVYRLAAPTACPHSDDARPAAPSYRVPLPDGTVRTVTTAQVFWQAVDADARWYLHLPAEQQALALAGYDSEAGQIQQIGAAVTNAVTPSDASGYAALSHIVPDIWETSYPHAVAADDADPTPARIFDVTLHEMIIEHLAASLAE